MLKIWGRTSSTNVMKVLWCAEELGLSFERVDAGGKFGKTQTPEYKAMNPMSLVPVIEDDGFVLWESNAIVRYLAAKHGAGTLWPQDIQQRAISDRWMDWQTTALWPSMRDMFFGLIRTAPADRNMKVIEDSRENAIKHLRILDTALSGLRFVAGDQLTMGDIALGCAAQRWYKLPIERPALPNVDRWWADIILRPAAKKWLDEPLS